MGVPDVVRQDILEGYMQAIGQAEEFIDFENQYFREKAIADAIIQRHKTKRSLNVIILLPKVAEELEPSNRTWASRWGVTVRSRLTRSRSS